MAASQGVAAATAALGEIIWGAARLQLAYVAVKLDVPGLLAERPRSARALAADTGSDPASIARLVRGWALLGLVSRDADDDGAPLRPTTLSSLLKRGTPAAGWVLQWGEMYYAGFGELLHTAKTGERGFVRAHGVVPWDYRDAHPEVDRAFNELMSTESKRAARNVVRAYDFAGARCVVDVGGGAGALLSAILEAHPQARGVLCDLERVVAAAPAQLGALAARCTLAPGSFFDALPPGGDVYVLSGVLHNWPDDEAATILRRCREAMADGARLLVVEALRPAVPAAAPPVIFMDLLMLVLHGGRERSESEYRALLSAAGFELERVAPTSSQLRVLVAKARTG